MDRDWNVLKLNLFLKHISRTVLFHPLFSFLFFFFPFSTFIFLIHNCLTLCVSTSLNLYSSWACWGMHQLRINDGILLKKREDILLMMTYCWRWAAVHKMTGSLKATSELLWFERGKFSPARVHTKKLHLASFLLFAYLMFLIFWRCSSASNMVLCWPVRMIKKSIFSHFLPTGSAQKTGGCGTS